MKRRDTFKTIPLTVAALSGLNGKINAASKDNKSIPYAEVKIHNGTPTLFLNGQPAYYSGMWVTSPTPTSWGHDKWSWPHPHGGDSDTAQRTAETGSHIYDFFTGNEWCGPRDGYTGHFDFSNVKASFERIIETDPQALFHLRIQLEKGGRSSLQGTWWQKVYPDECEITSEGKQREQSYASLVWREEAKDFLRAYIEHFEKIGIAERVIAYQVAAGQSTEWTKWSSSGRDACGDYSKPMRRHFRSWLRKMYNEDVAVFRKAWNNPDITFDTAEVPSQNEQLHARHFNFRDPSHEKNVIDYYTCLAELCSDVIIDFSKTIKEATRGRALTGASYGYTMTCSYNQGFYGEGNVGTEYSHNQRGGHFALGRILESPYIDFLGSPISYGFRGIGGDSSISQLSESARIHGKLLIMEDDSRIYHTPSPIKFGQVRNREDSIAVLRRNFNWVVTHGHGVWRPPMGDSSLYPLLKRFNELGDFALQTDRTPCAEVAVLVDEESFFYESIKYHLDLINLSHQTLQGLARFGAPYDMYLLDDFVEGRLRPYKLYLFLNAFHLNSTRRGKLSRELRQEGRTAAWIYAPGYIKDDLSVENMKELTGFKFEKNEYPWPSFMHITDFNHPITADLSQDLFWNYNTALGPLFNLKDPDAKTLGQVVFSQGTCAPGMGVKAFSEWTSIYIAVPNVPAQVLRGLARSADVHLYNNAGDVLYASNRLLGIHTVSGGERTYKLPYKVEQVYDLFNNNSIARDTDSFKVTLSPKSSELYYTGDRSTLSKLKIS